MLQDDLSRVLLGGWQKSGHDPAMLYPGDRRQIARRAFDESHLQYGDDPRLIAVALGFRVVRAPWLSGCGGEITDGLRIAYKPHGDPHIEQLRFAHGLAHALLQRERHDHSETDALLLTVDLSIFHHR